MPKLELGSGYHPTPGFLHLDANPKLPFDVDSLGARNRLTPCEITEPHADFRMDAANPFFQPETFDEIRAVDVLEHLSYRDTQKALTRWARILKPGGLLYVQVPDAEEAISWWMSAPKRLQARNPELGSPLDVLEWILLGGHADGVQVKDGDDFRWNAHFSLWSELKLRTQLGRAGLSVQSCETNGHPNLCCWAVKT